MMTTSKRDWELIESDCLVLLEWFAKRCNEGEDQNLYIAEEETGIPEPTIRYYLKAYEEYGRSNWFLGRVAAKYNFEVWYIGKRFTKLFVRKSKAYGIEKFARDFDDFFDEF